MNQTETRLYISGCLRRSGPFVRPTGGYGRTNWISSRVALVRKARAAHAALSRGERFRQLVIPPCSAKGSSPSYTPPILADGRSSHAHASYPCPTRTAGKGGMRNCAVIRGNRRGRYCLRRCCDGTSKTRGSNQPNHFCSCLCFRRPTIQSFQLWHH